MQRGSTGNSSHPVISHQSDYHSLLDSLVSIAADKRTLSNMYIGGFRIIIGDITSQYDFEAPIAYNICLGSISQDFKLRRDL